ncbi:sigma factor regulator VreR [Aliidongia dinghuensis]|uniref:Sigma factor regulator VreR n=1 Tax=Aliidongia dinghuensis TaxID=1867774 RepID=A0A8J3E730_9PROT|nr:FecR domain-containing protein [Aliidongia dinghuensis]GGF47634.1 sigma factor regulator VreR [Aliidongia dinghuensis]
MGDGAAAHPEPLLSEALEWVAHFALGKGNAADLERLKRWCGLSPAHAEAFAQAARMWKAMGQTDAALAARSALIASSTGSARPARGAWSRRAVFGGLLAAGAASIAYVCIRPPLDLWPSVSDLLADYRTATGEQRRLELADDVSVDMNTRTCLSEGPRIDGVRALELLSGEASVTAGPRNASPVGMFAADGRVFATQGKFNMRYDGERVTVSCLFGEARVEYASKVVVLSARQQVRYGRGKTSDVVAIDPQIVDAWQSGVLIFHAVPVAQAIEEVNRYRPGKIILLNTEVGARLFSARFRISNVDAVPAQLHQIFNVNVTELPGGIVLLS